MGLSFAPPSLGSAAISEVPPDAVLEFLLTLHRGFPIDRILPAIQSIDSRVIDREYLADLIEDYGLWTVFKSRRSLCAQRLQGIPSSYHVADLILPPFEW